MNAAIVTDSTADLPEELVDEYQIHVVRNLLMFEGQTLEDGKDITREEFYERLPFLRETPTTATASPGIYQQLYDTLFNKGIQTVLSIHASSLLSGIYNAAMTAAQSFDQKVHVIDSQQVSMGLGFQVLAAAEALRRGISLQGISELLENVRQHLKLVAMLDTLEFVRRSGRVSWARARLGNLLQIKPLIELRAGKVLSLGETRTRLKGVDRLKELILDGGAIERLAILHTNAEVEAHRLLDEMIPMVASRPWIVNVTPVIGNHVGPNGLGFTAVYR